LNLNIIFWRKLIKLPIHRFLVLKWFFNFKDLLFCSIFLKDLFIKLAILA
jgi:hypothetical protein